MNNIEIREHIIHITLDNRPQNYLTKPEFISPEKLDNLVENNICKGILIKGEGRHFSAGADLSTINSLYKEGILEDEMNKGKQLLLKLQSHNIPIVACIEGACFGGGLEIALAADIRIASNKAIFAFPEVQADLMPGLAGTVKLTGITGRAKALEIILKGDTINAETALQLKLVDQLCDKKQSSEVGNQLLERITKNRSLEIIKAVTESVRNASLLTYDEALKRETELFCSLAQLVVNNDK